MHPNSSPTPRVERRAHGAQRWRDCSGDVLAWDGTVLRITTLPGNVMVKGAEWRVDGTVYQHIIDPATGYPVDNGLLSVSIVTRRDSGGTGTALPSAQATMVK